MAKENNFKINRDKFDDLLNFKKTDKQILTEQIKFIYKNKNSARIFTTGNFPRVLKEHARIRTIIDQAYYKYEDLSDELIDREEISLYQNDFKIIPGEYEIEILNQN